METNTRQSSLIKAMICPKVVFFNVVSWNKTFGENILANASQKETVVLYKGKEGTRDIKPESSNGVLKIITGSDCSTNLNVGSPTEILLLLI